MKSRNPQAAGANGAISLAPARSEENNGRSSGAAGVSRVGAMMRGRYWILPAAIPAALLAADIATGASHRTDFVTARGLDRGAAAQGWQIRSPRRPALGGWPRAASVTVGETCICGSRPDCRCRASGHASGLALSVPLYLPDRCGCTFRGPQHLRIGTAPDSPSPATRGGGGAAAGRSPASFDLHATGVRVQPVAGEWQVTAGLLNARAALSGHGATPGIAFSASAEAIELPTGIARALGRNLSSLSAEGRLNGPFPTGGDVADQARAWRDNGGSLDIGHLAMGWGPLGLTASATLALDDQLQPMGSGNARIVGYADTLDRLAAAGLLTKSAATAAKAVLSLMAGTSDTDEPPEVDVPLTLQYRTLSMRQVPLARLPELDWPPRQ